MTIDRYDPPDRRRAGRRHVHQGRATCSRGTRASSSCPPGPRRAGCSGARTCYLAGPLPRRLTDGACSSRSSAAMVRYALMRARREVARNDRTLDAPDLRNGSRPSAQSEMNGRGPYRLVRLVGTTRHEEPSMTRDRPRTYRPPLPDVRARRTTRCPTRSTRGWTRRGTRTPTSPSASGARLRDAYLDLGHTVETDRPDPRPAGHGLRRQRRDRRRRRRLLRQVPLRRAPARGPRVPEVVRRPRLRHAHRRARPTRARATCWSSATLILAGTGFRTDRAAHAELAELFGRPVVSLELVDPHYYHLDTALAVLSTRPGRPADRLLPAGVLRRLAGASCAQLLPRRDRSPPSATPSPSGLNAVSDGHNVVVAPGAVDLAAALARARLRPDPRRHQRAAQGRRRRQVLHARDPRPPDRRPGD